MSCCFLEDVVDVVASSFIQLSSSSPTLGIFAHFGISREAAVTGLFRSLYVMSQIQRPCFILSVVQTCQPSVQRGPIQIISSILWTFKDTLLLENGAKLQYSVFQTETPENNKMAQPWYMEGTLSHVSNQGDF